MLHVFDFPRSITRFAAPQGFQEYRFRKGRGHLGCFASRQTNQIFRAHCADCGKLQGEQDKDSAEDEESRAHGLVMVGKPEV
ncbi:hypothetical protein GCM10027046_21840 [Uliginosibacterium flavum]